MKWQLTVIAFILIERYIDCMIREWKLFKHLPFGLSYTKTFSKNAFDFKRYMGME